jgi:hypothetical protein
MARPEPAKEQPSEGASHCKHDHWAEQDTGRDDQPLLPDWNRAHGNVQVALTWVILRSDVRCVLAET